MGCGALRSSAATICHFLLRKSQVSVDTTCQATTYRPEAIRVRGVTTSVLPSFATDAVLDTFIAAIPGIAAIVTSPFENAGTSFSLK